MEGGLDLRAKSSRNFLRYSFSACLKKYRTYCDNLGLVRYYLYYIEIYIFRYHAMFSQNTYLNRLLNSRSAMVDISVLAKSRQRINGNSAEIVPSFVCVTTLGSKFNMFEYKSLSALSQLLLT